jgi:aminodeoxyfutalosine deaminase
MSRSATSFALRARLVFPVEGPPLANGLITIAGPRIVAVGENLSSAPPIDLGHVAILPGLVNAHTHLEFSDLDAPLGEPGQPLPAWIEQVIAFRRASPPQGRSPLERGLEECRREGITALGEIQTQFVLDPQIEPPLDWFAFAEVIGGEPQRIEPLLAAARESLHSASGSRRRAGISPHAPYSVHPELFARLVELANQANAPVACHVAESREELEFLYDGSGGFQRLLEKLGITWPAASIPRGTRPLDYLRVLARAPRALVIHGNYLADDEVALLAAHEQIAVVYCPRTHRYFGHPRYPLPQLLAAGVEVALGTDSRASNPDLSLLAEMRYVATAFPEVSPAQVLELGTLAGARALGIAEDSGSLRPGKYANLAVIALADVPAPDSYESLFAPDQPVVGTMFHGQWTWTGKWLAAP